MDREDILNEAARPIFQYLKAEDQYQFRIVYSIPTREEVEMPFQGSCLKRI